jgi:uncharacterized protein YciU (UPF0263 family)
MQYRCAKFIATRYLQFAGERNVRLLERMDHKYKRRTYDEAQELSRLALIDVVSENLTENEINEMQLFGALTGGSIGNGWEEIAGFKPDNRMFYEYQIYKPSETHPYIEKYYVRMLVPRDRELNKVYFMWRSNIDA